MKHRSYVKADRTEEQREGDFEACSPGGLITRQYIPCANITIGSELRDYMASKGYEKSQRGMVPANDMEALMPLAPTR